MKPTFFAGQSKICSAMWPHMTSDGAACETG